MEVHSLSPGTAEIKLEKDDDDQYTISPSSKELELTETQRALKLLKHKPIGISTPLIHPPKLNLAISAANEQKSGVEHKVDEENAIVRNHEKGQNKYQTDSSIIST